MFWNERNINTERQVSNTPHFPPPLPPLGQDISLGHTLVLLKAWVYLSTIDTKWCITQKFMGLQLNSIPVAKASHMAKPYIKEGRGEGGIEYKVLI